MLKIHALPLGSYQTNCYIVHREGSDRCAVMDPGYEADTILRFLEREGLSLEAILLTHGHFDHVGAVKELCKATGCRLWMHERDYSQFRNPVNAFFYPIANCTFTEVNFCEHAEQIEAGGLVFTVLETPGHTWGSVCYLCEDAMFSGDTLFAGSCGRTDLPGGDGSVLKQSLEFLSGLETDYRVFPGHGESSSLAREKATNPYLRPDGRY